MMYNNNCKQNTNTKAYGGKDYGKVYSYQN
nr:MAG TPA: hypothetical protein [Caudoviricetes sp.]